VAAHWPNSAEPACRVDLYADGRRTSFDFRHSSTSLTWAASSSDPRIG